MSVDNYIIVITGLGGQGLISMLKTLGQALLTMGYRVITSETHGLSQRGGKVTCFLRFGSKLNAPIPMMGTADMIIALEESSILDTLKFVKPDKSTRLVISTYEKEIIDKKYPSLNYLIDILFEHSDKIYFIPATSIAEEVIKSPKVSNTVIMGFILRFLPIRKELLEDSLKEQLIGRDLDVNLKAFEEGRNL